MQNKQKKPIKLDGYQMQVLKVGRGLRGFGKLVKAKEAGIKIFPKKLPRRSSSISNYGKEGVKK
jgi:hypothetical protein